MDWNARTPSLWDWDNWALNCKVSGTPEQIHPTDWSVEGDEGINNGPVYSSGDGVCSGSELGNVSSSKSSISASLDSSSKPGAKVSEFNFQPVEGFPRNLNKRKQPARVEDAGTSDDVTSVGFVEPVIGLKLGRRTYFEDVCAGNPTKMPTLSAVPTSSTSSVKKSRGSCQGMQNPCCQVEGCNVDLSGAKDYHRRHRVCETHSKCPKVVVAGRECRFCQQCSRFHGLSEFDEKKRSCRRRLSDHNARRRKPQPETLSFNSMRISSSFYDGRQQMNFALNRVPVVHSRSAANALWESSCDFKLPQAKGSWIRTAKGGGVEGELLLPAVELPNTMSTLHRDFDGLLPFKGNTAEVLNQGLEASALASNLDATPDIRCALSLLSNSSWGSADHEPTSFDQLVHTSSSQRAMHAAHQRFLLASSGYWQAEQPPSSSHVPSLSSHCNDGQFQEFQLFKVPDQSAAFANHHMP